MRKTGAKADRSPPIHRAETAPRKGVGFLTNQVLDVALSPDLQGGGRIRKTKFVSERAPGRMFPAAASTSTVPTRRLAPAALRRDEGRSTSQRRLSGKFNQKAD